MGYLNTDPFRDVGTIRYLSHGFDDCELHKDLSVYEHLYDEGKARIDPSDQNVTVKAVYSQGRPLREGSVLPDFHDARYERRPVPPVPVPVWSDTPLNPGKRRTDDEEDEDQQFRSHNLPRTKRQRMDDVADDESYGDIVQSVERDVPMDATDFPLPDSPSFIQETQTSPENGPSDLDRLPIGPNANGKVSFHSLYNDTLGASLPPRIESRDNGNGSGETSGGMSFAQSRKNLFQDNNRPDNQALLTPPSDASKKASRGDARPAPAHDSKRKISPVQVSSSGLRRPGSFKKDIDDMENSEPIDDSQMSPKSRLAETRKSQRKRSASKSSRNRKEKESSRPYKGDVTMTEITCLIDSGGEIPPNLATRTRKEIPYATPDHSFTADEDGYSQQGDPIRVQNTSISTRPLPNDHASQLQGKEQSRGSFTTFSLNKQDEQLPFHVSEDVDMQDIVSVPLPISSVSNGQQAKRKEAASAQPETTSEPKQGDITKVKHANVKLSNDSSQAEPKRKRKKMSQIDNSEASGSMTIDTNPLQHDTKQNTPIDSPSEQLLEMQASCQKSRQDPVSEKYKKAEKQAKSQREKQETASKKLNAIASNRKQRRLMEKASINPQTSQSVPTKLAETVDKPEKQQKSKPSEKTQTSEATHAPGAETAEKSASSDSASKSLYARESPPKGSIGLGFTNSPRRPSTVSTDRDSLSKRKLFKTKPAPETVAASDTLKGNDSSSDGDEEGSDSLVGTPSKTARPNETQTPYQMFIAKKKPSLETSDSVRSDNPSTASVALPPGMTLEQFEAKKREHEKKFATGEVMPKPRIPTKNRLLKSAQESVSLAKVVSKESTSSVATSERAKSKSKRSSKKECAEQEAATAQALIREELKSKSPAEIEGKKPKKSGKTAAKATDTPSTTVSESSKASPAVPAKATAPSIPKPNASNRRGLKDLRTEMAAKSSQSSSAFQVIAPAAKPAGKSFNNLEDDSSGDESSADEDEDDLDQQSTKIMAASKPDASTRSTQDSDVDVDSDEDDSEE